MDFILITTSKTFDIANQRQIVGGVQTYTRDLCLLAMERGYHAVMYQIDEAQMEAEADFDGIEFHIVHKTSKSNQAAFNKIYQEKNAEDSLFVIATDQMDIKTQAKNVIVIQHGIAFDCPIDQGIWSQTRFLQHLNKTIRCFKNVRRLYMCRNTVCVDYNYYNWFRTLGTIYPEKRVKVIPNYSRGCISQVEFNDKIKNRSREKKIKVVFARRFCSYRGALIFANCVDRLLPCFRNVDFTFAGDGDLKEKLIKRFKGNPRVAITSYGASESIDFHKKYDIAIVPTVFSEGTSLSLLEAMSAGCFPIATHVGGMTNIVLDHYNGLLCSPDEDGVYNALVEAISMKSSEFDKICFNAYESAKNAFSMNQWKIRWSQFMDEVYGDSVKRDN